MTEIIEYPKIPEPFRREVSGPRRNKVIPWAWTSPELEYLANAPWTFTEKVDGTNIRVVWDGHKPEFRGRTDNANLPDFLLSALESLFPEELLEQKFGNSPAILFGEGYGPKIQKVGAKYRKENSFILFDVKIGPWWLLRDNVEDVAASLGLDVVPIRYELSLAEAIVMMSEEPLVSSVAESELVAEGLVGTPKISLFNRKGERVITKLKGRDLYGLQGLT